MTNQISLFFSFFFVVHNNSLLYTILRFSVFFIFVFFMLVHMSTLFIRIFCSLNV